MKDVELDRDVAKNWREYVKEARDMGRVFAWIWHEFTNKEAKRRAKIMTGYILISLILSTALPWTLGSVFTGLSKGREGIGQISSGFIWYCLIILAVKFFNYQSNCSREVLIGEMVRLLYEGMTGFFLDKSLSEHDKADAFLSAATLKKGHERIFQLCMLILHGGIEVVLALAITYIALWFIGWEYGLFMTFVLIAYVMWSFYLNRKTMRETLPLEKLWRLLNNYWDERIKHVRRVKTNQKEAAEVDEIGRQFENIIIPDRRFWLWYNKQGFIRGLLISLLQFFVMAYGAYKVWKGEMLIGALYALFMWVSFFVDNLWRVEHIEQQAYLFAPSIDLIMKAMLAPTGYIDDPDQIELPENTPGLIEFCNVCYEYPSEGGSGKTMPVLNDVSLEIEPGDNVGVVGPSGVGKSTLIALFLVVIYQTAGKIKIDGIDLRKIKRGSWLKRISVVLQLSEVMSGTIRDNLTYGAFGKVDDKFLLHVLQVLNFGDLGGRLEDGLDTLVGPHGLKLSIGQAQRLMLAAAIVRLLSMAEDMFKLLIIDEGTSSLDSINEKLILSGLNAILPKNVTRIIIAHRLATIRDCNKIIVLDGNGSGSKIVAVGKFDELIASCSIFRKMAKEQGLVV